MTFFFDAVFTCILERKSKYSAETEFLRGFFQKFGFPRQQAFSLTGLLARTLLRSQYYVPWKKYNIISFKSLGDPVNSDAVDQALIYLLGYIGMRNRESKEEKRKIKRGQRQAHFGNTTITLITANSPPKTLMREMHGYTDEVMPGKYRLNLNRFDVYLLDLSVLSVEGHDALFLLTHAPAERLWVIRLRMP